MINGDYSGYSTLGAAYGQKPYVQLRPAVTLEAEQDPQAPHQYRVATRQQIIPTPEAATDAKSSGKRPNQNNDPVSKAFLSVANYSPGPVYHRIDIEV